MLSFEKTITTTQIIGTAEVTKRHPQQLYSCGYTVTAKTSIKHNC